MVLRPYQRLMGSEKEKLKELLQANPPSALGHNLKEWFGRIIGQGDVEALGAWVHDAADGLKVAETTIHKEEGEARYMWFEEDGVWVRR